jgi:hypothetical protein
MTGFGLALHAACAVAVADCQDSIGIDTPGWLWIPVVLVGVMIVAFAMVFVRRGR